MKSNGKKGCCLLLSSTGAHSFPINLTKVKTRKPTNNNYSALLLAFSNSSKIMHGKTVNRREKSAEIVRKA